MEKVEISSINVYAYFCGKYSPSTDFVIFNSLSFQLFHAWLFSVIITNSNSGRTAKSFRLANRINRRFFKISIQTKRRRSDPVLWQKPLHQQKCQKGKVTTQTPPQKSYVQCYEMFNIAPYLMQVNYNILHQWQQIRHPNRQICWLK